MRYDENVETIKNEDGVQYTKDRKVLYKAPENIEHCQVLEGTETIGGSAFTFCSVLQSITLPDGLKEISNCAFYDCGRLTSMVIPDSVESIDSLAFYGCNSLKSINLPHCLKNLNVDSFEGTTIALTGENDYYKNVDNAIYTADMTTLVYCYSRQKVFQVKDGTRIIGSAAFQTCKELENVIIPETVDTISNNAFFACSSLQSVNIPQSVTEIGTNVFCFCNHLEDIVIPDKVETIGFGAFCDCLSLKKIVIPDSVQHIVGNPFDGCNCRIESHADNYVVKNDALFSKDGRYLIYCFTLNEKYQIADGVQIIRNMAFGGCELLKEVIIPASVTKIEDWAFDECNALERIVVLGKIKKHYYSGGFDNPNLCEISIPKGTLEYYKSIFCGDFELLVERNSIV